jgi:hypothetical protein
VACVVFERGGGGCRCGWTGRELYIGELFWAKYDDITASLTLYFRVVY